MIFVINIVSEKYIVNKLYALQMNTFLTPRLHKLNIYIKVKVQIKAPTTPIVCVI